jgi:exodeoxyribonuclease V gamma subunit
MSHLSGVSGHDALAHLDPLVQLYCAGLREPLPMPPKSACAYAEKRAESPGLKAAETKAKNAWRSGSGERVQGECTDAHHQRIWGDAEIDVLLATPPDPADTAWPDETHRFGQLARTVWAPLLAAEEVHSR